VDQASDVLLVPNAAIVNTDDVGPAAMVLGLDVESMDLSAFQRPGRGEALATTIRAGSGSASASPAQGLMQGLPEPQSSRDISRETLRAGVPAGGGDTARRSQQAVVFVMDSLSGAVPRLVEIGLNDWDRTEVISGLEEGEEVALIGAAQLQAQQQEFLDRVSSRGGSTPFGGGGSVPGGRGR
jgi:HlyD family secretion protein